MDQNPEGKWLVIVNPNAGSGRGKKDWVDISSSLVRENIPFSVKFTEKRGHAISLTLEGISGGFRKIIIVGGDGTLNEVVNGAFMNLVCPATDILLGVIPVGTGNDWGRMFGIPLNHEKAIKIIGENKRMLHDVGVVKYFERDEQKTRYFINIAGLGFESDVVKRTNHQKERGHGGKLIYLYNLLVTLISYRNGKAEIIAGDKKVTANVFSINIGNGRYCGGGMRQTPDAVPDDGFLDVTVIGEMGKIEIIRNLKILYNGKILSHPKVKSYRCKKLSVTSKSKFYVEADGESLGHTPAEISIIPGGINIVYKEKLW